MFFFKTPMLFAGVFRERGEIIPELKFINFRMKRNVEMLISQGRLTEIKTSSQKEQVTSCDGCGKRFANVTFVHAHRALGACGKSQEVLMSDPKQEATDREINELVVEQFNSATTTVVPSNPLMDKTKKQLASLAAERGIEVFSREGKNYLTKDDYLAALA